jgi:hypothetical protein
VEDFPAAAPPSMVTMMKWFPCGMGKDRKFAGIGDGKQIYNSV